MGIRSDRRPGRGTESGDEPAAQGGQRGRDRLGARALTHASFFSGVGGLDMGLERAGWRTVSFSEVEPYANAVLAERWPDVPNIGDIVELARQHRGTAVNVVEQESTGGVPGSSGDWQTATLWSGGFPCQDLSVAGKRRGMGSHADRLDTRSGLAYAFLDLVERYRPAGILLENVPGLLTSHRGRDFGALLDRLGELGYWWAYRILDAQHAGVPQRRRRVFIVALNAGAGFEPDSAAAVLSVGTRCERHSATGDQAGSGSADGATAGTVLAREGKSIGHNYPDDHLVAGALSAGGMDKHATQNVAAGHYIADAAPTLDTSDGREGNDHPDRLIVGDEQIVSRAVHTSIGRRSGPAGDETANLVYARAGHQDYAPGFGTIAARDGKDQSHLIVGMAGREQPGSDRGTASRESDLSGQRSDASGAQRAEGATTDDGEHSGRGVSAAGRSGQPVGPAGHGADGHAAGEPDERPGDAALSTERGAALDPGGVRAADGLAGGSHDRDELAYSLRADPGGTGNAHNTDYVVGPLLASEGGGRSDDLNVPRVVELAPTLRVGPATPADGGPGDTVPVVVASTLNSGGNDGGFRTEPGEHLVVEPDVPDSAAALLARASMDRPESGSVTLVPYVKRARAQSEQDDESWDAGDVAPTLNSFDGGDSRATVAIPSPGPGDDDPLLPVGLDSHRYRCCGNGVVTPVAEWIGHRLRLAFTDGAR